MINLKSIRKSMRLGASLMAVAVTIGAGSAFASVHIGGCNDTTGSNSNNTSFWSANSTLEIAIDNVATGLNDIGLDVNSGTNIVSNDTEACDVFTGNIFGDFKVINDLNNAPVDLVALDNGIIDVDLSNSLTGPQSINENTAEINRETNIAITNTATMSNTLNQQLNTGNNTIDQNTVVGGLFTGSIDVSSRVENVANTNIGHVALPCFTNPPIIADLENDVTGPNSDNTNTLEANSNFNLAVTNTTDINNTTEFTGDTGRNTVENNTVVGNVHTGNVLVRFDVLNKGN